MKLSKRKLRILFIVLSILSILVVSLCSFSFRPSKYQISYYSSRPSVEAVQNLMSIVQYQKDLNGFNRSDNILLMACRFVSGSGYRIEVYISSNSSFNFTVNGDVFAFTFSGTQVYYYNNSTGFYGAISAGSDSINVKDIYYSSVALPETSIPGFQGFNSNATFGSSNFNSYDVMSYFKHIHDAALYLDEYVSEAFSEGLATGQGEGYQVGLEDGYNQGYDSGFSDGEDRGYIEGQTEGYSEGYSDGYSEGESVGSASGYRDGFDDGREEGYTLGYDVGYDDGYKRGEDIGHQTGYSEGYETGYESGFSDGYETGFDDGFSDSDFKKPGQIIAQFWSYRDDSQYQGIEWFCTIEHNGITNFRWCTEDEIYSHYLNCEIYDYVYETNLYFQKNPLEFNYYVPQLVREESAYSGALSVENVEYRFVNLYDQRAVIELDVDHTIIGLLNDKYNEGIKDSKSLVNGVASIAKSPVESLRRALDFEIFGINVGAVAVGLVAILFAIWAYNKIRKLLPI